MTGDDAPSLTALLCEFGGLWVIARTPRGFTAQRRPLPAPGQLRVPGGSDLRGDGGRDQ